MQPKYRTIVRTRPYTVIYDNCYARLEANGRRYRVRVGGVHWQGNTGGYREHVRYHSIADGRKLLRQYRLAHAAELRGEFVETRLDILTSIFGSK